MNSQVKRGSLLSMTLLLIAGLFAVLGLTGCKSAPKETTAPPNVTTAPAQPSAPATPAPSAPPGLNLSFDASVKATLPLAYYRMGATKGASEVGATTYEFTGGATSSSSGGPLAAADNHFALLNGTDGWIKTTQMGGIETAGSIMAWVNLATWPITGGRIRYVAGESQSGDDFDVQFEPDNTVNFYTGAGGHVSYKPDPGTMVNQWHMIVATMDTVAPKKIIYWDGQAQATDVAGNTPHKTAQFTIGESPVFTGRFFQGGIAEVAIWDRALNPAEVSAIYKLATAKP